jgi:hypothetical protein
MGEGSVATPAWRVERIDFADDFRCCFCHRTIVCGKGCVVVDDNGNEGFCGSVCATKPQNVTNPKEKIPDLTRGATDTRSGEEGEVKPPATKRRNVGARVAYGGREKAREYLLLRGKKLASIKSVRWPKLLPILERYEQNKEISEADYQYLQFLMNHPDHPEFSLRNLQAVYSCHFWIEKFVRKNIREKDISFVSSVQQYLHRNLVLSDKQIDGLNKWFTHSVGERLRLQHGMFDIEAPCTQKETLATDGQDGS